MSSFNKMMNKLDLNEINIDTNGYCIGVTLNIPIA